jgi:hypothetical protein
LRDIPLLKLQGKMPLKGAVITWKNWQWINFMFKLWLKISATALVKPECQKGSSMSLVLFYHG